MTFSTLTWGPGARLAGDTIHLQPTRGIPSWLLHTLDPEFIECCTDEPPGAYRPLWKHVHNTDDSLYALQFFNASPVWGDCTIDTLDEELLTMENWLETANQNAVKARLTVAAQRIRVTQHGVLWSTSPKEGDGYFETRELSWEHLKQIAADGSPFAAAEGRKE